jgi:hypothetical protein
MGNSTYSTSGSLTSAGQAFFCPASLSSQFVKSYEKLMILLLTISQTQANLIFYFFSFFHRAGFNASCGRDVTDGQRSGTVGQVYAPGLRSSEDGIMAGLKLPRWLISLLCRWFPGRIQVGRRFVVRYAKPSIMILEDRWSPTSLSIAAPVELAPPLLPKLTATWPQPLATCGRWKQTAHCCPASRSRWFPRRVRPTMLPWLYIRRRSCNTATRPPASSNKSRPRSITRWPRRPRGPSHRYLRRPSRCLKRRPTRAAAVEA